jgi:REP element-mobilizing transposase RayT
MPDFAFMNAKKKTGPQRTFEFRTWGGARRGAGRKPSGDRRRAAHVAREDVKPGQPVHVSIRMADHVWNLRSQRSFRVVDAAIRGLRRRKGFRVVHFTLMGNHLHLIVEADGTRAFTRETRAFVIRVARGLNRMTGRRGPVFADRYDAHVLRTPTEARNAVRYVLGNFESHAERRGVPRSTKGWVDPFSSAATMGPREEQLTLFFERATVPAETWLLRKAS